LARSTEVTEIGGEFRRRYEVMDPLDNAYSRESMQRVLAALETILATDPLEVFPATAAGLGTAPKGPSIIVARKDRIDIRPLSRPKVRSAMLVVGSPELLGIQPVQARGGPLLVGYSRSSVVSWNPRISLEPVNTYEVVDPHGIDSVTHVTAPDGLHTYVLK